MSKARYVLNYTEYFGDWRDRNTMRYSHVGWVSDSFKRIQDKMIYLVKNLLEQQDGFAGDPLFYVDSEDIDFVILKNHITGDCIKYHISQAWEV